VPLEDDLAERLRAAQGLMPTPEHANELLPHLQWEFMEVLSHIELHHITASELMSLLSILCPIHGRVLKGVGSEMASKAGPILRVIR